MAVSPIDADRSFNGAPDWNPGKGVASEGVVYRWSKGFNGAPDWNPGKADWKDKRGKGKILFQWSPRLESGEVFTVMRH